MQIVIGGAGEVGYNLAQYLAKVGHSITVIDLEDHLIKRLNERLEVKAIRGHAAHPDVLAQANLDDADMLIAVTQSDETNIVACEMAHALFGVPKKIARIRDQSYLSQSHTGLFRADRVAIDYVISPEIEVAQALARNFAVPGAFDVVTLAEEQFVLLGLRCHEDTPIVNTPIVHIGSLFPEADFNIIGIMRDTAAIIPDHNEILYDADAVYLVCPYSTLEQCLVAFGHSGPPTRKLVIAGGGNVGVFLAQEVEKTYPHIQTRLIELDQQRAEYAAHHLKHTIVINGDALEPETLAEAGIGTADTLVCVTDDDRVNTLTSIMASRLGSCKSIVLTNNDAYDQLVISLGAEATITPRDVTISKILQYVRKAKTHSIHTLGSALGEVLDVDAEVTKSFVGQTTREVYERTSVIVAGVVRAGVAIIPNAKLKIEAHDRLILMVPTAYASDIADILDMDA